MRGARNIKHERHPDLTGTEERNKQADAEKKLMSRGSHTQWTESGLSNAKTEGMQRNKERGDNRRSNL